VLSSLERFCEYYECTGQRFEVLNGVLWREYNRMIVPLAPVSQNCSITKSDADLLLRKFRSAVLVRATCGFSERQYGDWYAVICTHFTDLNDLKAKNRSEIKRGLRNCKVLMVDASFIGENGFDVYVSAFERYRGVRKPQISRDEYKQRILSTKRFDDIIQYWAVFYESELIGYSENYIFDNVEVNYSSVKFQPRYLSLYPSYALFYTMNKFYLGEQGFKYVNDGFRSIRHQTNIQKYLIEKFGFERAYLGLQVFYRWYVKFGINSTFPFRNFVSRLGPQLDSLYKLEEIRREMLNDDSSC